MTAQLEHRHTLRIVEGARIGCCLSCGETVEVDLPADGEVLALSVTVYSTPACQRCKLTYGQLEKAKIPYTVVDVSINDAAREWLTQDLGYSEAPVVVVDQDPEHHWSGFRPDRIKALATHLPPSADGAA